MKKIKNDFPFFKKNKNIVYFDNSATTLKPQTVINKINEINTNFPFNAFRTEYKGSLELQNLINISRNEIANFISASKKEISFTYNATFGINQIAIMIAKFIEPGDEIILSMSEHSSNLLPWFKLAKENKMKIKYVELSEKQTITSENFKKIYTEKTKIVSLPIISNVIGKINECEKIGKLIKNNCFYVLDAVQSVGHIGTNVKKLNCDFLIFSGHKILGPTGIGVIYIKNKLLEQIDPAFLGGGMNLDIYKNGNFTYKNNPHKFEAGTINYSGIIGLYEAIKYIKSIGFEKIKKHEKKLLEYFYKKARLFKKMKIYNKNADIGIISFNIKNIFCQDVVEELSKNNIYLRSGDHCSKILNIFNKKNKYVRASFYLYNEKKEIDLLFNALEKGGDFLNVYF